MPILLLFIFLCCASGAHAQGAQSQNMAPGGVSESSSVAAAPARLSTELPADLSVDLPDALPADLDDTGRVDLYCLRRAYPQITGIVADAQGQWLVFADGRRVLYAADSGPEANGGKGTSGGRESEWVVNVRVSMAEPYPLEPERPETPLGVSPGRRRSYDLLQTLYGASPKAVGSHLVQARLLGQHLHLSPAAAQAMNRADAVLAPQAAYEPRLKTLLKMDGGFAWRRIAGENRLSPHAFGIAFDISPGIATYWRWSKLRPHPLQKSYPASIVAAFENEGFIWGGKWHEYDLMHFEYRPEIICKARVLLGQEHMPGSDAPAQPAVRTTSPASTISAANPAPKPAASPAGNSSGTALDTSAASPAGLPQSENAGAATAP